MKKTVLATRPEDILDTFQNRNLPPAEWENLADQLRKRGVEKVANELGDIRQFQRGRRRGRRSSRQTKSKEPKRFRDPVRHSIKQVSEELTGGALLKAALQEYRRRLPEFKERNDRPTESKLGLLERHLFKRKFGYATLDKGVDWNPSWRIDLEKKLKK